MSFSCRDTATSICTRRFGAPTSCPICSTLQCLFYSADSRVWQHCLMYFIGWVCRLRTCWSYVRSTAMEQGKIRRVRLSHNSETVPGLLHIIILHVITILLPRKDRKSACVPLPSVSQLCGLYILKFDSNPNQYRCCVWHRVSFWMVERFFSFFWAIINLQ